MKKIWRLLTIIFVASPLITHAEPQITHYKTASECYKTGYDHCVELRNRHNGEVTWIPRHHYVHVKKYHNIIKDSYKTKSGKILKKEYIKDTW